MSQKQIEHTNNYYSSSSCGIFDNPQFKEAFASLSVEEQEKYKAIGEELYGTTDFVTRGTSDDKQVTAERIAWVENQLRSGIHPSDMEKGEIMIMEDAHGEEWYTKWGYAKEDLDDIVTVMK